MGNACFRFVRNRVVRRKIVLLMIGLDNAGKTQTVNNLLGESKDYAIPTVGFKAVNLVHRNTPVVIFDLGGGPEFRQIWPVYYSEVHGVIFVIDSSDLTRLEECRNVLEEVLSHERISGKPVLILANKQDQDGALDDLDIVEKLNIEATVNKYRCPTLVESYTANVPVKHKRCIFSHFTIDPGLKKGYLWLLNYILRRYGDINLRVKTDLNSEAVKAKARVAEIKAKQIEANHAGAVDVDTATGFSNLTYREDLNEILKQQPGVINVKPAHGAANGDVEAAPDKPDTGSSHQVNEISSSVSEKRDLEMTLSPLFGKRNDEFVFANNGSKIELQSRGYITKLSPLHIARVTAAVHAPPGGRPMRRPQSSPDPSLAQLERQRNSMVNRSDEVSEVVSVVKDSISMPLPTKSATLESNAHRGLSDSAIASGGGMERPISASQAVRRQLEQTGVVCHRRRLTLRHVRRNRTSPEEIHVSNAIFSYDPLHQNREILDKGDFKGKPTAIELALVHTDKNTGSNHI